MQLLNRHFRSKGYGYLYIFVYQAVDSYGQSFGWKFRNNGSSRNVYC